MAIFIVLWPYLLTTKLRSVIRHNLGHSNASTSFDGYAVKQVAKYVCVWLEEEEGLAHCIKDIISENITKQM